MTNQVTYTVDLTPENASKIDAVNRILLGDKYYSEGDVTKTCETGAEEAEEVEEETGAITLEMVKIEAKMAKAAHGEDFAMKVLKDHDVQVNSSLGRSMRQIDESDYESVIKAWKAGPQENEDNDLDEFEDDDNSEADVSAEAVKLAIKAHAKLAGRDEALKIMQKHGASALSKVDDCSPKQLAAMFAELA